MANILIVGANQGIGYYLVERLLESGNSVTVLDIQTDAIEALKEKYQKRVLPVIADARNLASIENGVRQAIQHFGNIDIAIHNACLCTFESEHDTGYEVYQNVMDINYFGALRLAKCLEIENEEYGISFHLFHPPLTNTKSASGISVPKEFKAEAKKVGYGLADRIWSKKFVICHSTSQAAQIKFSYRHPLYIGKIMTKAAFKSS